ncbi:UNVERIFIED_CONTAM: hypothetical protein Cloal_0142 [Acetivibrio alkalicellulosi]
MEWWHWILVGIGVIVIGAIKISFFKSMKNKQKKTFTDDE